MQSHKCLVLHLQTYPLRLSEAENWHFKIKDVKPSDTDQDGAPLGSAFPDMFL